MDSAATLAYIQEQWDSSALPALMKYVEIPNLSPGFDAEWESNGLLDQAMDHLQQWALDQNIQGLSHQRLKEPGRTPLLLLTIEPFNKTENVKSVFMYGHMDKQPHFTGWGEGLGPTTPVIRDGKLYGRGASDDGYSIFAAVLSVKAIQNQGKQHDKVFIFIEAGEESGSVDLPHYINQLLPTLGNLNLIVCLDSGSGNYDQLWLTNSLRGCTIVDMKVSLLESGVHSGDASGVVPETFRVVRELLNRVDDPTTGECVEDFQVDIPAYRQKEIADAAQVLGWKGVVCFPFLQGAKPTCEDVSELALRRTWKAALSITGADGLPETKTAGNVLRPSTTVRLSLRLPPTKNAQEAEKRLIEILSENPPYGAKVECSPGHYGDGFDAPEIPANLMNLINQASVDFYSKPALGYGEGGSIPFMNSLKDLFPEAKFIVTGVLGPDSNAHASNEMLELAYTVRLICCLSHVLNGYASL